MLNGRNAILNAGVVGLNKEFKAMFLGCFTPEGDHIL
jgi:hypothetical protein